MGDWHSLDRRSFLASLAGGALAPGLGFAQRKRSRNDRIACGIVGLGSRGFNLIDGLLKHPDAEIVAICDVQDRHFRDRKPGGGPSFGREPARSRIEKAQGKRGLFVTDDFRKLCAKEEIDAVIVATPDHWHALCTLEALRHGKDVYCEKPVTHTFAEGKLICDEVARTDAVFQTGSQQRSDPLFRRAVDIVQSGMLGTLELIEVGLNPGYAVAQDSATVLPIPAGLDYDLWCGPAPKLPYMRARHHRWWRGHTAFGGGVLMDWVGHHNDIAHWALGESKGGPTSVEAVGWTFPETDVYDTPVDYEIRSTYKSGTIISVSSAHLNGVKFLGSDGGVFVTRGRLGASNQDWISSQLPQGKFAPYATAAHLDNFLSCVQSRKECVAPAEVGHRSITPAHLGYVSHALGRKLVWDAETQMIQDDAEATARLNAISMREPWELPSRQT